MSGLFDETSLEELQMGKWKLLRGKLGLGCDEMILGVSSVEGWGITALRWRFERLYLVYDTAQGLSTRPEQARWRFGFGLDI